LAYPEGFESLLEEVNNCMLTCLQCQHTFVPNRTNKKNPQKYCSALCVKEAQKSKKQIHDCLTCSKKTTNPKFCSNSCSASHNNTIKPKRVKQYKICPTCGTLHSRPKFCSDLCNPNRLNMTEEEKYRYIRSRMNEAWQRYMAKRKDQTPVDVNVKELQLFYLNCPEGHEVDHIIPISKGGLHSIENLQYLTISENRKKSNKVI